MHSTFKRVFHFHFICSLFDRNLKIGYFSQHHVDQLGSEQSPLELLASKFPGTELTPELSYVLPFSSNSEEK